MDDAEREPRRATNTNGGRVRKAFPHPPSDSHGIGAWQGLTVQAIEERSWTTITKAGITSTAQIWSWQSVQTRVTKTRSERSCDVTARAFSISQVDFSGSAVWLRRLPRKCS